MLRANPRGGQSGAATTEFALCLLILVPTLLYATFFSDMTMTLLKANEASRYAAWEMTAFELSDWQNHKHADKFSAAKGAVMNELKARWGDDDLDGATPTVIANYKAHKPVTVKVTFDDKQAGMSDTEAGIFKVGDFDGLDTVVAGAFGQFGFNTSGRAQGAISLHIENQFLHQTMPVFFTEKMLDKDTFDLTVKQSLIADPWALVTQGQGVEQLQGEDCSSDYCSHVKHMAFFSLNQYLSKMDLLNGVSDLLTTAGMHWPFSATVSALPLNGSSDSSHRQIIAKPPNHSPICKHYTNVYKDTQVAAKSGYYRMYKRLGSNYMGCREELKAETFCDYSEKDVPSSSGSCP